MWLIKVYCNKTDCVPCAKQCNECRVNTVADCFRKTVEKLIATEQYYILIFFLNI